LGRKKIIGKRKVVSNTKTESNLNEKEILKRDIILTDIDDLKKLPRYWMRAYSIGSNDTIEQCCQLYNQRYDHDPLEGWLYTNTQNQKILYLRIAEEEKYKK